VDDHEERAERFLTAVQTKILRDMAAKRLVGAPITVVNIGLTSEEASSLLDLLAGALNVLEKRKGN
jgi:hypothetical protein